MLLDVTPTPGPLPGASPGELAVIAVVCILALAAPLGLAVALLIHRRRKKSQDGA